MTSALISPSFKNIAAGFAGLLLALCCFFAAAPQVHALVLDCNANNASCRYANGLSEPQVSALLSLLSAFGANSSVVNNVSNILRGGESSVTPPTEPILCPSGTHANYATYQCEADSRLNASVTSGTAPLNVGFVISGTDFRDLFLDYGDTAMDGNGVPVVVDFQKSGHTYATPGTYTAVLRQCTVHTSEKSCDGSVVIGTQLISVISASVATPAVLSATPTSGAAPLSVSFKGSGSDLTPGAYISYGDGENSNNGVGLNATYTYSTPGTYIALLHKDGAKANAVASKMITVTSASTAVPSCTVNFAPSTVSTGTRILVEWGAVNATSRSYVLYNPYGTLIFTSQAISTSGRIEGQNIDNLFAPAGAYTRVDTVVGPGGTATCKATLTTVASASGSTRGGQSFLMPGSVPDVAGLMASAAMVPLFASADSISLIADQIEEVNDALVEVASAYLGLFSIDAPQTAAAATAPVVATAAAGESLATTLAYLPQSLYETASNTTDFMAAVEMAPLYVITDSLSDALFKAGLY